MKSTSVFPFCCHPCPTLLKVQREPIESSTGKKLATKATKYRSNKSNKFQFPHLVWSLIGIQLKAVTNCLIFTYSSTGGVWFLLFWDLVLLMFMIFLMMNNDYIEFFY